MELHYDKREGIGFITLYNPAYNSLVDPVFGDAESLGSFFSDNELKGVILQGEGRHFSSGADPSSFDQLFADTTVLARKMAEAGKLLALLRFAPVPTLACIAGSCLGAGLEIALCCHFRMAARSAMFGFPESSHKLMPGFGGTILGQHQVRPPQLIELMLSGRLVSAEEAETLGLVDRVTSSKDLADESERWLRALVEPHDSRVIRTIMQSVNNGIILPEQQALSAETELFCTLAEERGRSL